MKKFKVTNIVLNKEQIEGVEPWNEYDTRENYCGETITAETTEEAIETAIDYLIDCAGGYEDTDRQTYVTFVGEDYNGDEYCQRYCGFQAEEITSEDDE